VGKSQTSFQIHIWRLSHVHNSALARRYRLSRSTLHLRISQGSFPKQIPLGPRSVGWLADEVDAWIAQRVAQRDQARGQ
jgi:prophage regulatory protein